jgi:hypothetical protein
MNVITKNRTKTDYTKISDAELEGWIDRAYQVSGHADSDAQSQMYLNDAREMEQVLNARRDAAKQPRCNECGDSGFTYERGPIDMGMDGDTFTPCACKAGKTFLYTRTLREAETMRKADLIRTGLECDNASKDTDTFDAEWRALYHDLTVVLRSIYTRRFGTSSAYDD